VEGFNRKHQSFRAVLGAENGRNSHGRRDKHRGFEQDRNGDDFGDSDGFDDDKALGRGAYDWKSQCDAGLDSAGPVLDDRVERDGRDFP
jgi:hypothetical protein